MDSFDNERCRDLAVGQAAFDRLTVGVPVTDQDGALEFYTRTLGLEVVREFALGDGKRWIEVTPPGAATTIALIPADSGRPSALIKLSTPSPSRLDRA